MHFTYTVLSVISFACIAAGADPTCDVTLVRIGAACDDVDGFKNYVQTLTKCGSGIEDVSTKICLPEECEVSVYADFMNDAFEETGSPCRITFSSTTSTAFSRVSIIGGMILAGAVAMV